MELINTILKRRSIRKYTGENIPDEAVSKILQAGLLAPTSRNLKPCEFYIVRDKDTLISLSKTKSGGAGMIADCNAAIIVLADSSKADTWIEDCSIAMSYMMLMAEEQGIGNCWVQIHLRKDASGKDAEENVRDILSVSGIFRIVGILALGFPARQLNPHTFADINWDMVHRL